MTREPAALALTLHAGRALTVILKGTRRAPEMVLRHDFDLADPWVVESRHPYHQALGSRRPDGEAALRRGCQAARKSAARAVRTLLGDMKSHGYEPYRAAIVVSNLVDPKEITGAHAHAHAEEEALYRRVVEDTLRTCDVRVTTLLATTLRAEATEKMPDGKSIDAMLKTFSHVVGTPWAAAEKHASLAAWLVLPR